MGLRLALAFGLAAALLPLGSARAERLTHQVEAGEYLGLIAERYGVRVDELRTWNELEGDRLRIGQALVVSPAPAPAAPEERDRWEVLYTVQRGDNLTRVAALVGVSLEALQQANPDLGRGRLRPGQALRVVGPTRVVDHVARRGETLARLSALYEVRPLDLTNWNPSLRRRGLETGMTVRIYTDVRPSRSESVGAPNGGALAHGEVLPAHRAYVVRDPNRAYGTHETIQAIVEAFDVALDADPTMPRLRIHDLSTATGGRLAGHRSHQSGRDADIAFYRRQCAPGEACFMSRSGPEDLDVVHQWRLFRYWLERGTATHIFVDYALQAPLYEHAREHGATPEQLSRWFQYPRPIDEPVGVIRHAPSHDDHFHVRFACPSSDEGCTEATRRRQSPTAPSRERTPNRGPEQEHDLVATPGHAESGPCAHDDDEPEPEDAPPREAPRRDAAPREDPPRDAAPEPTPQEGEPAGAAAPTAREPAADGPISGARAASE